MNEYKFLFPFESVEKGERVLIYGAGNLGQAYLKQLLLTQYAIPVGIVDRFSDQVPRMVIPVYAPDQIHALDFDRVVVALRGAGGYSEVHRILCNQGVDEDKIVFLSEREDTISSVFLKDAEDISAKRRYAYQQSDCSIACYLLGGLGDFIIQKKFMMALVELLPQAKIDLYIVHNTGFLSLLYREFPNVVNIIMNTGKEFEQLYKKYAVSFEVCGGGFLKLAGEISERLPVEIRKRFSNLQERIKRENYDIQRPMGLMYARRIKLGLNCYTGFQYGGIFPITDRKVPITLRNPEPIYKRWKGKKYMTVNGGNGDSADGNLIAKSWPLENFERFIDMFNRKYPDIAVIQIGSSRNTRLRGVDERVLGASFDTVGQFFRTALFHLDIEGGMVHFATQLDTKCIVLFGPTPVSYYGYPQNINLLSGNCHDCYGFYRDTNVCARGEQQPSCMRAITPEMVMEAAERLLQS